MILGENVRVCSSVRFMGDTCVEIGESTWIGPGVVVTSDPKAPVRIGKNVDIAFCTKIIVGSHELGGSGHRAGRGAPKPIEIGDGTWIGASSTIVAGATIGKGVVVAAGSVVVGPCDNDCLYAGVPAVKKKELPLAAPRL